MNRHGQDTTASPEPGAGILATLIATRDALRDFAARVGMDSPLDDLDRARALVLRAKELENAAWVALEGRVTMQEAGDHFGVSRQRAQQRVARARRTGRDLGALTNGPEVSSAMAPDARPPLSARPTDAVQHDALGL
jgi:hypothetical protein